MSDREESMPIASPEKYRQMIDSARDGGYAYPAINVTSSETLNATLRGFSEAESDGIVQVSTGGAEFLSGSTVKDMPTGAAALAEFAEVAAARFPANIALHTDHCQPDQTGIHSSSKDGEFGDKSAEGGHTGERKEGDHHR